MRRAWIAGLTLIAAVSTAWVSTRTSQAALRDGDLVFQVSSSAQSRALRIATQSHWSHMGLVVFHAGKPQVLEAAGPVRLTPWSEWVASGVGEYAIVKRLRDADQVLDSATRRRMRLLGETFLGRPYDPWFRWGDDRLYCSELVYKIYQSGAEVRIGHLQQTGDMDLSDPEVQRLIQERFDGDFDLNETVITPQAMFEDPRLVTILETGRAPTPARELGSFLRLAVANLQHLNDRATQVSETLLKRDADLLVLFEWTGHNASLDALSPGMKVIVDEGRAGTHGICVLANSALEVSGVLVDSPIDGPCRLPLVSLRLRMGDDWLSVLGVHAPPPVGDCASSTTPYLDAVRSWIGDGRLQRDVGVCRRGDLVVVGGDLNALPTARSIGAFASTGLRDVQSSRFWLPQPTWSPGLGMPALARLDYILAPRELSVSDVSTIDLPGSDHHMVQAEFEWTKVRAAGRDSDYRSVLVEVARKRRELARRLSSTPDSRAAVLEESRLYLTETLVDKLFPAWYGTPWSYHGTSQVPNTGSIACGYFVTTTLRDVGFKLARIALAQEPSESMIQSLCSARDVRRFRNVPIEEFVAAVREMGPGLYVLGLDQHTGFIVHDGRQLSFVHSSYVGPQVVLSESLQGSFPVRSSRYRVVGKILKDGLLEKWLNEDFIAARGRP